MNYSVKTDKTKAVLIHDLPEGTLAVAVDSGFAGELFYKNVAGVVGISKNRYWPSAYVLKTDKCYLPEFNVQPVEKEVTILTEVE